jgi:hypothetical protein
MPDRTSCCAITVARWLKKAADQRHSYPAAAMRRARESPRNQLFSF